MLDDTLLNADELARILDVRPATIRRWARQGILPEIRIGPKTRRFCYGDVLAALRKRAPRQSAEGVADE
jgi:excisionase family DNA binding protein